MFHTKCLIPLDAWKVNGKAKIALADILTASGAAPNEDTTVLASTV